MFDRSILWMATIPLCDKSRLHNVNAAKLVSDITGIFVNILCDKSKLNQFKKRREKNNDNDDDDDADNPFKRQNHCRSGGRQ